MRKYYIWLILFAGAIIRYISYINSSIYQRDPNLPIDGSVIDEVYYYIPAMNYILENGWYSYFTNEISVMFTNGNPIYLVLLHSFLGNDLHLFRLVNIVTSCIIIFIIYKLVTKVFDEKTAIMTAAISSFNPFFIQYSYLLLSEIPFLLFLFLGLYLFIKNIDNKYTIFKCFIIAVCFFWAALSRSVVTLLPIFLVLSICGWGLYNKQIDKKKILVRILLVTGLFSFLVFPIIAKNHILFEIDSLSTGSGAVLYIGSRIATNGDEPPYYGVPYDTVIYNEFMNITGNQMHYTVIGDKLLQKAAIDNIKQNFSRYMEINFKKIARISIGNNYGWFHYFGSNLSEYYKSQGFMPALLKVMNILLYVYVFVMGIYGIKRTLCDYKAFILIATIVYFFIFSIPFLAILRYGLPIFILTSIFAAYETIYLLENNNNKRFIIPICIVAFISCYICIGI